MNCKVNKTETLYETDWLKLNKAYWNKSDQSEHQWEYVARKKCDNIIMVIPKIKGEDKYIILKQYRPPLGKVIFEFPAGLVESGEDIDKAAKRELLEETGFHGELIKKFPDRAVSAGLTSEVITIYLAEIDVQDEINQNPSLHLDESEEIEVLIMSASELKALQNNCPQDHLLDVKLSLFVLGSEFNI